MDKPTPKKPAKKKSSAAVKKPVSAAPKKKAKKTKTGSEGTADVAMTTGGTQKQLETDKLNSDPKSDSDSNSGSPKDTRTQYEKLVNPQNYHEYMRASRFRGGSSGGGGRY